MRDGGPDAGASDAAVDAGPDPCDVMEVSLADDASLVSAMTLAAGTDGFLVAWVVDDGDGPVVVTRHVGSDGTRAEPETVSADDLGVRDPAVLALSDGYLVVWSELVLGMGYELFAQRLGNTGAPVGDAVPLTDNMFGDDAATLARTDAGNVLLWSELDARAEEPLPVLRRAILMDSGAIAGDAGDVMGMTVPPSGLAVDRLGNALGVAFVDEGMVTLATLASDGGGTATLETLTTTANAEGGVDYRHDDDGGALVWGAAIETRREVRFRAVGLDGTAALPERNLTRDALQGSGPSLTEAGGGWLVSYLSPAEEGARVRLALVERGGELLDTHEVAETPSWTGRTLVRTSTDGVSLVVWTESTAETAFRGALISCGEKS